jgi:hypothetical protein
MSFYRLRLFASREIAVIVFEFGEGAAYDGIKPCRDPFFFAAMDVRADRLIL